MWSLCIFVSLQLLHKTVRNKGKRRIPSIVLHEFSLVWLCDIWIVDDLNADQLIVLYNNCMHVHNELITISMRQRYMYLDLHLYRWGLVWQFLRGQVNHKLRFYINKCFEKLKSFGMKQFFFIDGIPFCSEFNSG